MVKMHEKTTEFLSLNSGFNGEASDIPGIISWPLAVAIVYSISTVGSVFGGWVPKKLMNGGMATFKARKTIHVYLFPFPIVRIVCKQTGPD